MNKMKIKIHVPKMRSKQDSMFYYGQHIATLTKGKRKVFVESSGEMQAYFSEKGDCYKNDMLAKELESRKLNDKKLSKLSEKNMIQMNNWFRIVEEGKKDEDISHTYDEAIAVAKEMLR